MDIRKIKYFFTFIVMLFLSCLLLFAQSPKTKKKKGRFVDPSIERRKKDTLKPLQPKDTLPQAVKDSIHRADSLFKLDSLNMLKNSSLERPAFSTAKDSIVEVFVNGEKLVYYYGDVTLSYQDMKLKADFIEYNMASGTVYAKGRLDSLTGEWIGRPEMEQGGKTYKMEELRYNFNTRKAFITNMLTSEGEGLLHGRNIKMQPDQSINMTNGRYTVCDLEEPHYFLKLTAAKVITKPSQKTVFGPAFPVIADIPLPIGLPFGFIPKRPQRATGLLMPTFGEEVSRGFYLRNMGMYFVFGNYFDLSLTGDLYTLGSWSIYVNSRYKFNYIANGNFSLNYSNDITGEKGSPDYVKSTNFGLQWSHQQDAKFIPGMNFSASVNFSSPSNSRFNSYNVKDALENQISSSISISKNWGGKVNLSINALHNQNSRDSSYSFTLPNISLSVSRMYPFKRKARVGKERFYEKISFGYNTSFQNRINFKAKEFNKPGFDDKFKNGMNHSFSIGLPSFTLFKFLNFTPSISYGQTWFFRRGEKYYDEKEKRVKFKEGKPFSHLGITHTYSGSLSMNTRIYGTLNFGKLHRIQAIRHIISPSVSFSFSPEKGKHFNGWRILKYTDSNGKERTEHYNIYEGQIGSYPGRGKSATASISIGNNLEMKVRDLRDTTGKGVRKIKLIDQFSIRTGYNFLADSMKMSNVGVSLSTSIFGKVGFNANANFDPYAINNEGRRISKYNVTSGKWWQPLRLTNASASISYSISGQGTTNGNDGTKDLRGGDNDANSANANPAYFYRRIYYHPITAEYIPGGWLYYTNPNVPWSVNFNYSFSYSRSYNFDRQSKQLSVNNRYVQTLGVSGNIKISPRMSINASSGFDLMALRLTTTQISATYDLHCFNISVSWVPTGTWQSYSFRIAANAAALADLLKFRKSSSFWDK